MRILQIFETADDMLGLTKADYMKMFNFLKLMSLSDSPNAGTREVLSAITVLRKGSAKARVAGVDTNVPLSGASSGEGRDVNIARGFSGNNNRNMNDNQTAILETVAEELAKAAYIKIDYNNGTTIIQDREGLSRLSQFLNVNMGFNDVGELLSSFPKAVENYKRKVDKFSDMSSRNQGDLGSESPVGFKELTPNVLVFIANVSKKFGNKDRWDNQLNPSNYKDSSLTTGMEEFYNPEKAAHTLVQLGLAKKLDSGNVTLDKKLIKRSVSNMRNTLQPLLKGTLNAPSAKSGGLDAGETASKNLLTFVEQNVSTDIKKIANQKLREYIGSMSNETLSKAMATYDNKLSDVSDEGESVSGNVEKVRRSYLGRAIELVRARLIVRFLDYYASSITGDKPAKKPQSFVTSRDVQMIGRAFTDNVTGPMGRSRI